MDKEKIMKLCQHIGLVAMSDKKHYPTLHSDFDFINNAQMDIFREITAQPKSNADRIRQMTDEELADFFCRISQCCGNDASCSMCPIFEGCAQNVMCVERWLRKEVSECRN